jgi:hypothetical protein
MMKKFFKIVFIALGVVLASAALLFHSWLIEPLSAQDTPISDVREGDVIFQTTQSSQSPLIQIGTRSRITHCGIIVMRDGEPYVLETLRTLVLTPLDEFIARGQDGKYWLKRSDKENIQIEYSHYLGKTYDAAFSFDNDIYYCSELVYDIYKKQLGIELCKPKRIDDYLILCTDRLPQIESVMKRRGITKEQYAVAPVDIFESEYLRDVE